MKLLYSALLFLLLFYSCHEDVLQYSCDPVLNGMITNHLAEYAQYTVKEISVTDITVQRAIFRSFEPAKKREIWIEKIKYILENENYTTDEYAHVEKLLGQLTENYFDKDSVKIEASKRLQFSRDWKSSAKNNLGWSDKYIAFVTSRLYTAPEQLDAELSAIKAMSRQASASSECNCASTDDFCYQSACNAGNCTQTTGCGWLWNSNCDGTCQ